MSDTIDTSNVKIDSTFSMAQSQTPTKDHVLFVFKIGTNGKPQRGSQGWYTIQALLTALGQAAVNAENGAIAAKQAAENAKAACEEALTAIGNSDSTGLRGDAIEAINQALSSTLTAIGQDNSTGARGQAIAAIATALQNTLASIGQSDTTGARGQAISAIAEALTTALQQWNTSIANDKTEIAGYKTDAVNAKDAAVQAKEDAQQILENVQAAANVSDATAEAKGIMKLFGSTGTAEDGAMSQKATTDAIANAKTEVLGNFELTASSYSAAVTA